MGKKKQPDPVSVNPHLALISPAYPVGTMASRASLAPTLPLVAPFPRAQSNAGSVHRYEPIDPLGNPNQIDNASDAVN